MMKNMKKMAALGMTAILGASMLAGCGGSGSSSKSGDGKTELSFGIWDEKQRPAMESLVEAYEKENPDLVLSDRICQRRMDPE